MKVHIIIGMIALLGINSLTHTSMQGSLLSEQPSASIGYQKVCSDSISGNASLFFGSNGYISYHFVPMDSQVRQANKRVQRCFVMLSPEAEQKLLKKVRKYGDAGEFPGMTVSALIDKLNEKINDFYSSSEKHESVLTVLRNRKEKKIHHLEAVILALEDIANANIETVSDAKRFFEGMSTEYRWNSRS